MLYRYRELLVSQVGKETPKRNINKIQNIPQKNVKNKEVMISKYCIKNQLGLCPKQTPIKKYAEPFVLIDEFNKEYLVEFCCKDCVMKIKVSEWN